MKISSINIRDFGGLVKKRKVRDLVKAESLEYIAIQETKIDVVDRSICLQL